MTITLRRSAIGTFAPKYADAECSVLGCNSRPASRGWCADHYKRWWRTGDPQGKERGAFWPRFWSRVSFTGGCWLWLGAKTKGYGSLRGPDGVTAYAHILAYELIVGPIPVGLELDHLCLTPACLLPDHLEPVTHRENMRRYRTAAAIG